MKVLIFDIETSPNLAYVWGKYEQNVIDFKREWQLLSFAYKWLGEEKLVCVTREGQKSDKALTRKLWRLLDEADVVITHNGDAFDIKKARAKFIEHGLGPTSPFKSIDTKKIAANVFKFNSNKLDDLGKLLGVGRKVKTEGFELWLECMADVPAGWKKMSYYNMQDVLLLERIYYQLRPWVKSHPNFSFESGDGEGCPKCKGTALIRRGFHHTATSKFQIFKCKDCGAYSRSRLAIQDSQKAKVVGL